MQKALLTSAIMLLGLTAVPARAMPLAPLSGAPTSVTQVAWGGGPNGLADPTGVVIPWAMATAPSRPSPFTDPPTSIIAGSAAGAIVTATSDGAGLQAC
jgi:hypothetical protein